MARNTLVIRAEEASVPAFGQYEIFGTNGQETLTLPGAGNVVLDASFNKGGDIIRIEGAASDYTAALQNANLILTSRAGGYLLIPVGSFEATLVFMPESGGEDARTLAIVGGSVTLGSQIFSSNSATALVDVGDGAVPGPPVDPDASNGDAARNTLFIRSSEAAISDIGRYAVFGTTGPETLHISGAADVVLDASFNKGLDVLRVDAVASDYSASLQNANLILSSSSGRQIVIPVGTVGSTVIFNTANGGEDDRLLAIVNGSVALGGQVIPFSGSVQVAEPGSTPTPPPTSGTTVTLDDGDDILSGSSGNDLFEAPLTADDVAGNRPTLNSGDRLIGGAGLDTLSAELAAGSGAAVRPTTVSVEAIRMTALAEATSAFAELDARNMYDVESFTSSLSTGSMLISHANTLAGGVSGPVRPTEAIGIRMASTGAGSDFALLFDEPYLLAADGADLVTVQVRLDDVGRGGDGGDLLLGSAGSPEAGAGIARFAVTVAGDQARSSSLASISSTNGALNELVVTSAASGSTTGGAANLAIGNGATGSVAAGSPLPDIPNDAGVSESDLTDERNNALVDLALVDATGFAGGFELHASITADLGAKLFTGGANAEPDALAGTSRYLFGTGEDLFNLNISQAMLRSNSSDGDFKAIASMGAGDDTLQVQAGDGQFALGELKSGPISTWYGGHLVSENLVLTTGAGDDVVWTFGATAALIETGSGADVIYTDNSGTNDLLSNRGYATWLFNARNLDVESLTSAPALSVSGVANLLVSVTYLGFTRTIVVADSLNAIGGVTITDLDVNAAIGSAINDDSVLGQFLSVVEGPGRTLTVLSRVDGEYVEQDLAIELFNTPLNGSQLAGGAKLLDATQLAAFTARYDSQFAEQDTVVLDGRNSQNLNSNVIEPGAGNDVVVLSSNVSSIETLKITSAFGTDHVANFSAFSTAPAVNESQIFFVDQITGGQGSVTAVTYSLFGLEPQTIAISAGATASQIAQAIAGDINTRFPSIATASVEAAGSGQNNLVIEADGPEGQGIDFGATSITVTGSSDNLPVSVVLGDIVDGQSGGLGFDIFDVSALTGEDEAPAYFFNGTQDDGDEVADLTAFVDSRDSGVLMIDTLYLPEDDNDANALFPGDFSDLPGSGGRTPTLEAARLQKVLAALDDTATDLTAGDDTQKGVIITVDDPGGGNGQSANFYQYINGEAAGDATVTFLGTVRLAEYGDPDKARIGNWDALTIENFSPLSGTELFDTYMAALVA